MEPCNVYYRLNDAPICVELSDWPIVAEAQETQVLSDGVSLGAAIIIRKHADGRVLSEFATSGGLYGDKEVAVLTEADKVVSIADEARKAHYAIRYLGAGFVAGEALESLFRSLPCEKV